MFGLVVFLVLALLVGGALHGQSYFIDYSMYDRAGSKVLSGDVADLHELFRLETPKFHYSYFFAFLFSALTRIGPALGKWIFATLIGFSFLWALFASFRLTQEARGAFTRPYLILFLTILLSVYSLNDNFMTSNVAVFLLALMLLSYWTREEHPCLSGGFLGAAIVIKLYPLSLLGFYLWERRPRLVGWTLFWSAFFYWGLPSIVVGPQMATRLLQTQALVLNRFGDHWPMDCIWFQCLPATVLRYAKAFGVASPGLLRNSFLLGGAGVAIFFFPSFLTTKEKLCSDFRLRMFFLVLAVTCLLLPVCWYNVGIFYLPACLYLLARWWEEQVPIALWSVFGFGVLYGLTTPDILGTPWNDRLEYYSIPFWGAVLLTMGLMVDTWRTYPQHFWGRQGTLPNRLESTT